MTTARGMPTAAHSSHSSRVTPSTPSVADDDEQRAVRRAQPRPQVPGEVRVPGVSSRLTVSPSETNGASVRFTDRFCLISTSSKSLAVVAVLDPARSG